MRKHLLSLFLVLFTAVATFAQVTTGSMSGVVLDEKGQTVPGATIVAVHTPTGTNYSTSTRADGRFNLANIRVGGPYTFKVSFIGYNPYTQGDINISLGQDYKLNIKLSPTTTSLKEVTISGVQDKVINNSRTGQITTVSRSQIDALPSVSRSIFDYTKLEPTSNGRTFGGRNDQFNSITIDGALFNNSFGLSSTLGGQTNSQPISLDAVEQIQVAVSPYDVTQGRFAGSGINMVTKSGTNEFKGTAYYYFRNNGLVGLDAGPFSIPKPSVSYNQKGVSVGGPIIKNKVFLFFSAEQERVSDPGSSYTALRAGQTAGGSVSQAPADTLIKLQNFLQSKYGFPAGDFDGYNLRTQSDKISAKLDINIDSKNTLSIKYFYLKSLKDIPPSGRGPSATNLPLFSSYYTINNNFNIGIAELNTRISSTLANKFTIGYQALRDFRSSQSNGTLPYVEIGYPNAATTPETEFGYEQFTANNLLNTNTFQLSDNFTIYKGKHEINFGTTNEINSYKNGFAPQYNGAYFFNNLNDFINSANNHLPLANRYLLTYSAYPDGSFPYAYLHAASYGLYVQDKWQINDRFRLTYGLRADMPTYSADGTVPNPNVQALNAFRDGLHPDVSQYPATRVQLSPRIGYNWDVNGDATTQIRGGIGIFTGPPPFVYVSNQASNNGVQFGAYTVTSGANPGDKRLIFQPDVNANRPAPGTATANTSYNLALVSPDFRYPKNMRADIALDQKLPYGVTGTLEFLYTRDINGAYQQNIALPSTGTPLVGSDNRIRFASSTVYPTIAAAAGGNTAANPAIGNAIYLRNTSKGYTYNATAQLQKNTKNYSFTVAYTHGDSRNVNDGGSTASGQWSGRPVSGDPNADVLSYSGFYQPDRIVASFSYHREYLHNLGTSVGLTYEAANAGVASYTYQSGTSGATDFNGDGINGNDLMYIPKDATDIILVPDGATDLRSGTKTLLNPTGTNTLYAQLNNYINQDPYLYKRRGQYAERNGLVLPNYHLVNFNFTQKIFIQSGKVRNTLQFEFNMINLGNFLNRNWGTYKVVNKTQPLSFKGIYNNAANPADPDNGKPTFSFPYLDAASQTPLTSTFTTSTGTSSRWQAQIGLRYIFN
jgi:hypothetical protein